jgi:DNA-binding MarR family transcriptional regulator
MSTVKRIESATPEQRRVIKTAGSDSVERMLHEWRRERPQLNASPLGIQGRVVRVSGHLLRRVDEWLGPLGLSWEAFSLIVTLRRSGKPYEMRPTDILQESLLTSGAITNRIDRVAKMGLVKRYPDPDDRRGYLVKLTPAGKKLADKAIARHFAGVEGALEVLSPAEQDRLAELLSKLLASLENETPEKAEQPKNNGGYHD